MKNKRIIVTGAAGFIGTNVVKKLLEEGAVVKGIWHYRKPRLIHDNLEIVNVDLTSKESCIENIKDADYLIMTAAFVGGAERLLDSPMDFVIDTTVINMYVLDAAYRNGIKNIIYLSSGMVYPESEKALKEEWGMEGEPYEKYYFGGWSRRYAEILCGMYAEKLASPINITVLRIDNIYGPYDSFKWEKSHVMAALIRKAVERMTPLEVWGDGLDYKDFIFVEDLVKGVLQALKHMKGYQVYNIASGVNVTINEVLKIILEETGYQDAEIVYNLDKPTMIPYKVLSIEKARNGIKFYPSISLREGIHRTVEWYRRHPELPEIGGGGIKKQTFYYSPKDD